MSGRPWYAHFPADYERKTSHLTMLEDGAYRRLLDHYYATGRPLPAIAQHLHRICRAFADAERAAIDFILVEFFALEGDGYHNKRADEELGKASELGEIRRKAALSKGKPKKHLHSNSSPNAQHLSTPSPSPSPSPSQIPTQPQKKEEKKDARPNGREASRGTRWIADALVPNEWILEAERKREEKGLGRADLLLEAEKFANYWASKAGRDATKLDWRKTWINRALSINTYGKANGNGRQESGHEQTERVARELIAEFDARDAAANHGRDRAAGNSLPRLLAYDAGGSSGMDDDPVPGFGPQIAGRNPIRR